MHNKVAVPVVFDHQNRSIRKSKSTSNISIISKKKMNNIPSIKIEVDVDEKLETNKSSPTLNKTNGNISPNHRRRPKRSSINNNSLLTTVASVHELMSFVIHKDNPPSWLKQTDLYKEYTKKSQQITTDNQSLISSPHYHQQVHRKQSCNLQMYARSGQSWQALPSPPLRSPSIENRSKVINRMNDSNELIQKTKYETIVSPIHSSSSIIDFSTPLNISIKQEPMEQNSLLITNKTKSIKQQTSTRRQHMICKKKLPQNGIRRRQRMNSVNNQELLEKKDSSSSSSSSSSSQQDSNTSTTSSSSIEHTSPSPTTTISASSSRRSSPAEYMRGNRSINTRLSSPLRIQTSMSPRIQSLSTPQRRSTRIWAPSSFYINPMWILPNVVTSKRLLVQNTSSSPPSSSSESTKRLRRRCRS